MIMPGRSCVAGIAIAELNSLHYLHLRLAKGKGNHHAGVWANYRILYGLFEFGKRACLLRLREFC
jgi:hypothetical protein